LLSPQASSFPKTRRLLKKTDFDRTFDQGSKFVSSMLVVIAAKTPATDSAPDLDRIGLVVSKKVGNSVVRNRVKRVLREAFRIAEGRGLDLVVIARPAAANADFTEMEKDLGLALKKLHSRHFPGASK
jgi:ribonuclease P protein component